MACDERLLSRVRRLLANEHLVEKRMFGGVTFMVNGHMCVGVHEDRLMVRVGPDRYDESLSLRGAKPMDFTGKPLKGLVWVEPDAITTTAALKRWVYRGIAFVGSLPAR